MSIVLFNPYYVLELQNFTQIIVLWTFIAQAFGKLKAILIQNLGLRYNIKKILNLKIWRDLA